VSDPAVDGAEPWTNSRDLLLALLTSYLPWTILGVGAGYALTGLFLPARALPGWWPTLPLLTLLSLPFFFLHSPLLTMAGVRDATGMHLGLFALQLLMPGAVAVAHLALWTRLGAWAWLVTVLIVAGVMAGSFEGMYRLYRWRAGRRKPVVTMETSHVEHNEGRACEMASPELQPVEFAVEHGGPVSERLGEPEPPPPAETSLPQPIGCYCACNLVSSRARPQLCTCVPVVARSGSEGPATHEPTLIPPAALIVDPLSALRKAPRAEAPSHDALLPAPPAGPTVEEQMAAAREAERAARESGDLDASAEAMGRQAELLTAQGDTDTGEALWRECESIRREAADQGGVAMALARQAWIKMQRGDLAGAESLYREAETVARAAWHTGSLKEALLGQACATLVGGGSPDEAAPLLKELEGLCRASGDRGTLARCLYFQALLRGVQGDLEGAVALYQQEHRVGREYREAESAPAAEATQESPQKDPVDCTVFAPPEATPKTMLFVQVFAHLPESAEEAQSMAQEFDEEAERRGVRSLGLDIERGSKLTFHLAMPGLEVDEPAQELTWRGQTESVQYAVTVPETQPAVTVVGTVTVSRNTAPLGHVKFKLKIVQAFTGDQPPATQPAGDAARRYELAFVSYASADREKVLARVQMLKAVGIRYFQDILSLDPGDRWERKLYQYIDECDLFLLFWSSAARDSEWVLKEVRYALDRKAGDELAPPEVRPVIIEGPPIVPPPPELSSLHFNDPLIYFMTEQPGPGHGAVS